MVYTVITYIVMAYVVMAYIVMAHIVMAHGFVRVSKSAGVGSKITGAALAGRMAAWAQSARRTVD